MTLSFSTVAFLVLYLGAITFFGAYLGRRRRSVDDYFLAERSVPWWAIAACVVATETSVLTFTSVPGFAYGSDWSFLQLVVGCVLGRILIYVSHSYLRATSGSIRDARRAGTRHASTEAAMRIDGAVRNITGSRLSTW